MSRLQHLCFALYYNLFFYFLCVTSDVDSSAAMATGPSFYYLKGAAAALEVALVQYAMQKAIAKVSKMKLKLMLPIIVMMVLYTGVCSCYYSRYCSD